MVVIYTQDETFIIENADAAKGVLCSVYRKKLGQEAYNLQLHITGCERSLYAMLNLLPFLDVR